jgi:replicative DNA helicase
MSVLALARRLFGLQTGVNPNFIRSGRLSTAAEREMRRQLVAMAETEVPLYWLAGNFKKTIPALKASIYEAEPDIVFLDAAYLLKPESKQKSSRREVIADVIEELAGLFKEIDRPGIISVQFNRQAVKPKKGEDEEASTNPLGHLSLEKIGETDVIGQSSSIVLFLEKGDAPHENTRRYMGIGKGREGEEGWMEFNYKFQPVNMSMIRDHRSARRADNDDAPQPDMSFMEA